MPRTQRLDYPCAIHHVMNRGARHDTVFHTDADCAAFLAALGTVAERCDLRIHAYALMPNHYHLLVETPRANLSRAMQLLGASATRMMNRLHPGWDGPLFRGRFQSRLVEDEEYWLYLVAYLHLNPVRANLVTHLDQSRWTSHEAYMGRTVPPEWLHTQHMLDLFGGVHAYVDYLNEVQVGRMRLPEGFKPEALMRPARAGTLPSRTPPLREPRTFTAEEALAQISSVTGADAAHLREGAMGRRGNPARWVAAWWLERAAGLPHTEIAALLDADLPSISRWVHRVRKERLDREDFRAWTELLLALPQPTAAQGGRKGRSPKR